jgi:erythromycin esterase-like protein
MRLYRLGAALGAVALLLGACRATEPAAAGTSSTAPQGFTEDTLVAVRHAAIPIRSAARDYDPLIANMSGATRVLLGESTHGTHEYYRERARISLRLIREAGVNAVAIEGDWSPTYRLNLYVRGLGSNRTIREAMRGFTRFPEWMWPNTDFAQFVEQLRAYNLTLPANQRVGLYGMDVYDLYEAAEAVAERLRSLSPEAGRRAKAEYRCFSAYGRNTHTYGEAAQRASASCQEEAAAVLAEVRRLPRPASSEGAEAHFAAIRAASSVVAAEEYFRTVYRGANAWNVRDRRMEETVEAIGEHVSRLSGRPSKLVMWSHNTHSGDARATFAAARGELNLGQLMKQRHGERAYLVGFFTNSGTVLAASEWDQPARRFDLRPALAESISGLFHRTGVPAFTLLLRGNPRLTTHFSTPALERAVGVIYVPAREREAHYFDAVLAEQFDAAIYFDRTRAVEPL